MSDPIEKLTGLGDALEGAPMPMSAAAARARGDRIRRRNQALLATGAAAVVAAVTVPLVAFTTSGSGDKGDPVAPRPTISDPVPGAGLSAENLLTGEDAVYPNGGSDWREADTFPGDGQAAFSPCTRSPLGELGADSVFQRDFEFVVTDTGDVEPTLSFSEIIGEFGSDDEAATAYEEIRGWYDTCTPPGSETFSPGEWKTIRVGVDGRAQQMVATYGPVDEELDPFGNEAWILDTGLVLTGDRVAVLTQLIHGQDYNWESTPVEQMLPVAAERLAHGGGADETDTVAPEVDDWPTEIPATFPLTSGMPEDDGSDEYQLDPPSAGTQAMIPARELQACGNDAVARDAVDRLTTRLSYGSAAHVRELQLFVDDQEAVTWVAQLRNLYQSCPADGQTPTFTTTVSDGAVGEESVVVQRASDGIGRVVIHVVRVGNAVAVELVSDEANGSETGDLVMEARENLADVIGAMYDLQGGAGAEEPAEPGLTDPAGTTEVPEDFPLDAAPESAEGASEVFGPDALENGVFSTTMCGEDIAAIERETTSGHLGYRVIFEAEGYHGRRVAAYPTVQAAVDQLDRLRQQLAGCERDTAWEGTDERVWHVFDAETGYDGVVFGHTSTGAPTGTLYTVVRVGNALLTLASSGEYSEEAMRLTVPDHQAVVDAIAPEMCIFTADGC